MVAVPVGVGAYKRASAFVPEVRCVNMYIEKDDSGLSPDGTLRVQRPGLTQSYTLAGAVEAMEFWPKRAGMLAVAGGKLYLDGVDRGTVPTSGVSIAVTNLIAAVVAGGRLYVYNTDVTQVTIPDSYTVVDIAQINGYILALTPTGRFYWLVPGETVIDPLNFATAEASGDEGRAIHRLGDEFFIFGSDSTEVWQPTGDSEAPFAPAPGRLYQRGCMDRETVCQFDNALVWVGDDGTVYRLGPVPQAISTPGLDERIRKRTDRLSAWVFKVDGHEFYCLRIPGQGVFGYDASMQQWAEFTWDVTVGQTVDGVTYAGSPTGIVHRVDAAAPTDNGNAFERLVTGTVGFTGKAIRNDSLSVGVGASADCTVRIRWKDGQDDYPVYHDEIDIRAPMDVATMYRLGEPDQPHRTFEVSCVDPVIFRIAGLVANEGWGGGN